MDRTYNTLFMLMSLDGKISTGSADERDVDKDYKVIPGIKEGLHQYYDLEKIIARFSFSLSTGKIMSKIGVNSDNSPIKSPDVSFIIVDNNHLTKKGVINLANNLKKLFLVTKNPDHPAFQIKHTNLEIIKYENEIDFADLFSKLKDKYDVDKVTIQSGGTLNSILLRKGLIDAVSIVIAPALIGGKDTPTLIDGESLMTNKDLENIKTLKIEKAEIL